MARGVTVLQIAPLDKKRRIVTFETENGLETIALYLGELRRFHLVEGETIEEEKLRQIEQGILRKRARERSMYLLGRRDYTTFELQQKLKAGYYPERVIEETLSYLSAYRFIDDRRYVERYVNTNCHRKSFRQIHMELRQKGISEDILETVMEQDSVREEETLAYLVEKRCRNRVLSDPREWRRQCTYFVGKGFSYENVRSALVFYMAQTDICQEA